MSVALVVMIAGQGPSRSLGCADATGKWYTRKLALNSESFMAGAENDRFQLEVSNQNVVMSVAELSDLPSDVEPLDPGYVAQVISKPPFTPIDGVHNIRTLGPYPTTDGRNTRANYIFRSAEISGITEQGKYQHCNSPSQFCKRISFHVQAGRRCRI
jgi:hypothetical protein